VAWACLGLALALGLVRFWRLGEWSLWLDEAFTLADSRWRQSHDNPLGYLLLGGFYGLWEGRPNEFLLRLPAAAFGFLSIPATWWAFRALLAPRAASAAALIVAASSWHLYWSQNARFYTLTLLLAVLSTGVCLRGLVNGSLPRVLVGLGLGALAALTHPSAALLLVSLVVAPWAARGLGAWPEAPTRSRAWLALPVAGVLGLVVGLPWGVEVWRSWAEQKGFANPRHFVLTTGYLLTPTLGVWFLIGAWVALTRRSRATLLGVGALLGLACALLASLLVRVSAQYVFVFLPWIAAVTAAPLRRAQGIPRSTGLQLAALALIVAPGLVDGALYFVYRNGDRPQWREAYRYVFDHARPDDLILGMDAPVGEYYLDARADDLRHWSRVVWFDRFRADTADQWARYGRRTWFVVNHELLQDFPADRRAATRRLFDQECREVARFELPWTPRDLDVFVYVREPDGS